MARFAGKVGFIITKEHPIGSGIWKEVAIERTYYGDIEKNTLSWRNADRIDDDKDISNKISIVADPFAYENFHAMRYVEFMGSFWEINSISVERPRLVLSIGGLYNGGE